MPKSTAGATAKKRKPPRPTTITWCTICLRAGMRLDKDRLDKTCRYCGGLIAQRRYPTLRRARTALTERWKRRQRAVETGDIIETALEHHRYQVARPNEPDSAGQ